MKSLLLLSALCILGCAEPASVSVNKLRTDQGAQPGTAVVVLVDTSGSMENSVSGGRKCDLAKEALHSIVAQAAQWKTDHPDKHLLMGVYSFCGSTDAILQPQDFDAKTVNDAVNRIPSPGGGTAIGTAIKDGYQALYDTGCNRKFLVCVTDGENSEGADPAEMSQQLYEKTGGDVRMEFVAFDVAASRFSFLSRVNGGVIGASDGKQLTDELKQIYEHQILAEAPEPGSQPDPRGEKTTY